MTVKAIDRMRYKVLNLCAWN